MEEEQAIEEAFALLQADSITADTAAALEALKPYITDNKYGDLWSAFITAAPIEVVMALDKK